MKLIYLIRHGEVYNPQELFYGSEVELSERGKRQMTALAQDLQRSGVVPQTIVASPHLRTRQSTEIICGTLDAAYITDGRLVEWDVGHWFGRPKKIFYEQTRYDEIPLPALPPEIESLPNAGARVRTVIAELLQSEGTGLIVSHREPMVSALIQYQNLSWDMIHTLPFHVASAWRLIFSDKGKFISAENVFNRHADQ